MNARTGGPLQVEVVFALPERQELVELEVHEGATVGEVIDAAGIAGKFPEHDLSACAVGIWGRVVARDQRVSDGDRVEIYRPLAQDPQTARRERAGKA